MRPLLSRKPFSPTTFSQSYANSLFQNKRLGRCLSRSLKPSKVGSISESQGDKSKKSTISPLSIRTLTFSDIAVTVVEFGKVKTAEMFTEFSKRRTFLNSGLT